MDPLTEFYLAMAQQGLSGKPGTQLNTGDMSSIFSKNLGMLTGTLTDTNQTDDDIYASVAPNIFRVKNNREADETATIIVDDLESGFSLPQVIAKLRTLKSGDEFKDYKEYAEKVSKEMGDFKTAIGKRTTPASEAGLPEPNAQFDPTPKMANIYARLVEQSQPKVAPSLMVSEKKERAFRPDEIGLKGLAKVLNPFNKLTAHGHLKSKQIDKKQVQEEERYAAANDARVKIAAQNFEDIKSLLAGSMQRDSIGGSPFMDELFKRTIMKRLIENPGAISKLQNPKG